MIFTLKPSNSRTSVFASGSDGATLIRRDCNSTCRALTNSFFGTFQPASPGFAVWPAVIVTGTICELMLAFFSMSITGLPTPVWSTTSFDLANGRSAKISASRVQIVVYGVPSVNRCRWRTAY